MITPQEVLTYANIPASYPQDKINEHINNAINELKANLVNYEDIKSDSDHPRYQDLKEAHKCQALIFILPTANTFFVEGIPGLNQDGVDSRFLSPAQVNKVLGRYEERLEKLVLRILGSSRKSRFKLIGGVR